MLHLPVRRFATFTELSTLLISGVLFSSLLAHAQEDDLADLTNPNLQTSYQSLLDKSADVTDFSNIALATAETRLVSFDYREEVLEPLRKELTIAIKAIYQRIAVLQKRGDEPALIEAASLREATKRLEARLVDVITSELASEKIEQAPRTAMLVSLQIVGFEVPLSIASRLARKIPILGLLTHVSVTGGQASIGGFLGFRRDSASNRKTMVWGGNSLFASNLNLGANGSTSVVDGGSVFTGIFVLSPNSIRDTPLKVADLPRHFLGFGGQGSWNAGSDKWGKAVQVMFYSDASSVGSNIYDFRAAESWRSFFYDFYDQADYTAVFIFFGGAKATRAAQIQGEYLRFVPFTGTVTDRTDPGEAEFIAEAQIEAEETLVELRAVLKDIPEQ